MGLPARPTIEMNRWQEDWSVLADPSLRTEPFDDLKYIPLSPDDPQSYVSLGLDLRERFESLNAATFGVGGIPVQNYVLDREYIHADIRPNQNWQIFIQLQDDYAPGKSIITPVDRDPLDLAQGFIAYTGDLAGGEVKVRVGRQEMAFDLQRFVSIRDGPNVRQAYDAAWFDWEKDPWRIISFWSEPVIYVPQGVFNDYSNGQFQFGGFRVERRDVRTGTPQCLLCALRSRQFAFSLCQRPRTARHLRCALCRRLRRMGLGPRVNGPDRKRRRQNGPRLGAGNTGRLHIRRCKLAPPSGASGRRGVG